MGADADRTVTFSVALELPPCPWTLAVTRHALEDLLDAAEVAQDSTRGRLALALTEACANAVCHASTGGPYQVRIQLEDGRCVMEVSDRGPGFDPDQVPAAGPEIYRPRGLLVIRAIVDHLSLDALQPTGTRVTMVKKGIGKRPLRGPDTLSYYIR